MAAEPSEAVREIRLAGIRARHPELTERESVARPVWEEYDGGGRRMNTYTSRERFGLMAVAIVSGIGLNGVFLYGVVRSDVLIEAVENPIAVAFILEAFVLVALLAYLLERWEMSQLRWPWLVGLSLLGGLAFALPVLLLWGTKSAEERGAQAQDSDRAAEP